MALAALAPSRPASAVPAAARYVAPVTYADGHFVDAFVLASGTLSDLGNTAWALDTRAPDLGDVFYQHAPALLRTLAADCELVMGALETRPRPGEPVELAATRLALACVRVEAAVLALATVGGGCGEGAR
jgi:hypothetical protein